MIEDQSSRAAQRAAATLKFEIPAGACDCHVHIFGHPTEFPLATQRSYTPEPALPEELATLHEQLHMRRVVIVTPSVYGTDNSSTLLGLRSRGPDARGIALIDDATTDAELDRLDLAGIRGIRLNFSALDPQSAGVAQHILRHSIDRIKSRGWHIQILTQAPLIAPLSAEIRKSPIPVVFDHFAGAVAEQGVTQTGFAELIDLVRSGTAYVKISAAYRQSQQSPGYANVLPLAQALIAANPDRVLWGTDWPHPDAAARSGRLPTGISPRLTVDDVALLNLLAEWAPDVAVRKKILVENPIRLFGF